MLALVLRSFKGPGVSWLIPAAAGILSTADGIVFPNVEFRKVQCTQTTATFTSHGLIHAVLVVDSCTNQLELAFTVRYRVTVGNRIHSEAFVHYNEGHHPQQELFHCKHKCYQTILGCASNLRWKVTQTETKLSKSVPQSVCYQRGMWRWP